MSVPVVRWKRVGNAATAFAWGASVVLGAITGIAAVVGAESRRQGMDILQAAIPGTVAGGAAVLVWLPVVGWMASNRPRQPATRRSN